MDVTLLIAAVIIIYFLFLKSKESFATNKERDDANRDYFEGSTNPSYEDYRDRVSGGNIVDYMKYRQEKK